MTHASATKEGLKMKRQTVASKTISVPGVNLNELRLAIQSEYEVVANNPEQGFHFHTGRPLTRILGYNDTWLEGISETAIGSFAGTGNPFSLGELKPGNRVVDVGSGAGMDSLIAGKMVGPEGNVVGVDMTPAMLGKARRAAAETRLSNVEFREAYGEAMPVLDGWADVVISNGVLNLFPDKPVALEEMARILKPGGRLQIADILVDKPVPNGAKSNIDLWTG
jgi:SAM-dependent methyltransferase